MRQPGFRGKAAADIVELAVTQTSDQVAAERDSICVLPRKTLLCQRVSPPIERGANFRAEAFVRELKRLAADQAPVEPARSFRCCLLLKVEI